MADICPECGLMGNEHTDMRDCIAALRNGLAEKDRQMGMLYLVLHTLEWGSEGFCPCCKGKLAHTPECLVRQTLERRPGDA